MNSTPIALFTYNRAAHTARALDSLLNCSRLNDCQLYIYCDGPKDATHVEEVEACRRVVRERASQFAATVVEREENVGLAKSIVSGVTDLCERYGRVIVIEDDLVVSPNFIDFMLRSLDRYADAQNVFQISGYMFPVTHRTETDSFFLPLTTTWGWATWKHSWKIFDWDASDARERLRDPNLRKRFDLGNSYPYARMLEDRLNGFNNSWGILFWWAVFRVNGLALHPRESLVWNGGFDGTGTHCGFDSWSQDKAGQMKDWTISTPYRFPAEVEIDQDAFDRICKFLKREQYSSSPTARIWRRLRQYAQHYRTV